MIEVNEPDAFDKAFVDKGKPVKGVVVETDNLLTKTKLTNQEAIELIQRYNQVYRPHISKNVRCGGTIKRIQQKLIEYKS